MVEAMARSMNGAQPVTSGREGCSIADLLICLRHALPAEGVHRYTDSLLEGNSAANVVRVPMSDEDAVNTTPLCPFCYDGIKIGRIVNRGINYRCSFDAAPKYNGIGTRPGHDRRIGGQDNRIWRLHCNLLPKAARVPLASALGMHCRPPTGGISCGCIIPNAL